MVVIKLSGSRSSSPSARSPSDPANYTPFAPNGWTGIHQGAAIVFFAYIGFDAISTAAEETQNPNATCRSGFSAASPSARSSTSSSGFVLTGLVPYQQLEVADPLRPRLKLAGLPLRLDRRVRRRRLDVGGAARLSVRSAAHLLRHGARWPAAPVGGEDPPEVSDSARRRRVVTGLVVALGVAHRTSPEIYDLTNIGTLFAFAIVCVGVLVLRVKEPDRPRPFRVPLVWPVAILGTAACIFMMVGLPRQAWERFGIWLLVGMVLYSAYGFRHSRLHRRLIRQRTDSSVSQAAESSPAVLR